MEEVFVNNSLLSCCLSDDIKIDGNDENIVLENVDNSNNPSRHVYKDNNEDLDRVEFQTCILCKNRFKSFPTKQHNLQQFANYHDTTSYLTIGDEPIQNHILESNNCLINNTEHPYNNETISQDENCSNDSKNYVERLRSEVISLRSVMSFLKAKMAESSEKFTILLRYYTFKLG